MTLRRIFLAAGLIVAIAAGLLFLGLAPGRNIPVLMYHHVTSGEVSGPLEVSSKTFEMQMRFLKEKKYRVILPDALIEKIRAKENPRKEVVLTFDDGYFDNFVNAYPILEQVGFKAVFFIVTDWVGQPGFMDWKQIRTLAIHGHVIGPHSAGHLLLTEIGLEQAKEQIYNSKLLIQENLGIPALFFCYPAGRFNTPVKAMVQQAGYQAAFATAPGRAYGTTDLFAIKRIRVSESSNRPWKFWWRVSGYYLRFREWTARRMKG